MLDPRHAIEQRNALDAVANTLGYDAPAVGRAFRADHWEHSRHRKPAQRGIDR
jgi:hypothetical protein